MEVLLNITEVAGLWAADEGVSVLRPVLGNKHDSLDEACRVIFCLHAFSLMLPFSLRCLPTFSSLLHGASSM